MKKCTYYNKPPAIKQIEKFSPIDLIYWTSQHHTGYNKRSKNNEPLVRLNPPIALTGYHKKSEEKVGFSAMASMIRLLPTT